MRAKVGQRELERLLKYWVPRLRLMDWKVTIRYSKLVELVDCQGRCDWNLESKNAEIQILAPKDYNPKDYPNEAPQDVELTVVHELLHLHLAPWNTRNKAEELLLEQAIESVSKALIDMKRRKYS